VLESALKKRMIGFLLRQVEKSDEGFHLTTITQPTFAENWLTDGHDAGCHFASLICTDEKCKNDKEAVMVMTSTSSWPSTNLGKKRSLLMPLKSAQCDLAKIQRFDKTGNFNTVLLGENNTSTVPWFSLTPIGAVNRDTTGPTLAATSHAKCLVHMLMAPEPL